MVCPGRLPIVMFRRDQLNVEIDQGCVLKNIQIHNGTYLSNALSSSVI